MMMKKNNCKKQFVIKDKTFQKILKFRRYGNVTACKQANISSATLYKYMSIEQTILWNDYHKKKKKPFLMTDEIFNKIIELKIRGFSLERSCSKNNVSSATFYKSITDKQREIWNKTKKQIFVLTDDIFNQIIDLESKGETIVSACKKFDIFGWTFYSSMSEQQKFKFKNRKNNV